MRKTVCVLAAVLCLFSLLPVFAAAEPAEFPAADTAGALYMLHLESGRVVGRKNETDRRAAGASVKLLSGLVACEWLGDMLDETVTVEEKMIADSSGKRFGLRAGDSFTWREMLLLAICGSYNDAYDVIAYRIGNGSAVGKSNFVDLLNTRAKELGATATMVGDSSGVADNSYTSAYDLSVLARAAAENELYLYFAGLRRG